MSHNNRLLLLNFYFGLKELIVHDGTKWFNCYIMHLLLATSLRLIGTKLVWTNNSTIQKAVLRESSYSNSTQLYSTRSILKKGTSRTKGYTRFLVRDD